VFLFIAHASFPPHEWIIRSKYTTLHFPSAIDFPAAFYFAKAKNLNLNGFVGTSHMSDNRRDRYLGIG
jgi:hypothetical protein